MIENPILTEIIAEARAHEAARVDMARMAEIADLRSSACAGVRPSIAAALVRLGLHIDAGAARSTAAAAR